MRERAWATIGMWVAMAIAVDRILASLKYTELIASPVDPTQMIPQTMLVSEAWQIGAAILIFLIIMAAMGGTIAIWQHATQPTAEQMQAQSEKAKRDNREARVKRLLAALDDEDLALLEDQQQGDAEERLSLEALLRKK